MESETCKHDDEDIFIYVDKHQRAYCAACFIKQNLHKEIHAEKIFINNYKFDMLKENDDSREMKMFIDYHADYGKTHSIIEILKKECEHSDDIWYQTIYEDMTMEELLSMLDTNYCAGTVNKGRRSFCGTCKNNLRIVAYFIYIGNINNIVEDWGKIYVPRSFIHESIKRPQLPVNNPDLYRKSKQNWKIFDRLPAMKYIFTIEPYIEELQNYDVLIINANTYYDAPIKELVELKNLKGLIICSPNFNKNLDCLECLEHLQFIQLPERYDQRMSEKIYNIAFRIR